VQFRGGFRIQEGFSGHLVSFKSRRDRLLRTQRPLPARTISEPASGNHRSSR
jgi:hypothetical protein